MPVAGIEGTGGTWPKRVEFEVCVESEDRREDGWEYVEMCPVEALAWCPVIGLGGEALL